MQRNRTWRGTWRCRWTRCCKQLMTILSTLFSNTAYVAVGAAAVGLKECVTTRQ